MSRKCVAIVGMVLVLLAASMVLPRGTPAPPETTTMIIHEDE